MKNGNFQKMMRDKEPWTDEELRAAVVAYFYLLKLQQVGIAYSTSDFINFLFDGPLVGRSKKSITFRMRNISDVLQDRDQSYLRAFSPATNVGTHVRLRIQKIIDGLPQALETFLRSQNQKTQIEGNKSELGSQLSQLRKLLLEFENPNFGIGHNNSPYSLEDLEQFDQSKIDKVYDSILHIEAEIKELKNPDKIKEKSHDLVEFGLDLCVWIGQRLTKLSDAAMVSTGAVLGPVIVAKYLEVLPEVIKVAGSVGNWLSPLLPGGL